MCDELTETDLNICMMAVIKCHLLNTIVKAGLPAHLTPENFGFVSMTDEEESELVEKLHRASERAWLRMQPKEIS